MKDVPELAEQVELVGRRWKLLEFLSTGENRVNELAAKLSSSPALISKNLKELKERGLVEKANGDGGAKGFRSTDLAKRIMNAAKRVSQPESKVKLEDWRIDELFNVLEDKQLSRDLRLSYSETLMNACLEHPTDVIGNENARRVFEKASAEPFGDEVNEKLAGCLSRTLNHAGDTAQHALERRWVSERLLPILLNNMKNRDEKVSVWSMEEAVKIAGLSDELRLQVRSELLKIWFSNKVKVEDSFGVQVCKQLSRLTSQTLFEIVRTKMKSKDKQVRAKAERLLEELGKCLL